MRGSVQVQSTNYVIVCHYSYILTEKRGKVCTLLADIKAVLDTVVENMLKK